MRDEYEQDERTVAQALEQRAARLKEVLSWTARRLDGAATMVDQATQPYRPEDAEYDLLDAAQILSAAQNIPGEVVTILNELDTEGFLLFEWIRDAFEVHINTSGEESNKWKLGAVAQWPVRDLKKRLETKGPVAMFPPTDSERAALITDLGARDGPSCDKEGHYVMRCVDCPTVSDPGAFGLDVVGDSMMPDYQPGDVAVCSPSAPVRSGDNAWVTFLRPDGRGLAERVNRVFFEPDNTVRLRPSNPRYPPWTLERRWVLRMVRVVARMPAKPVHSSTNERTPVTA